MIQLHATRKLFERLPLDEHGQLAITPRSQWLFEQPALADNPLSGWYGNLVTLQRRNCLLMVHEATRFPLVLPALTKPELAELNDRFIDAFMNTLLKCGAEEAHLDAAHRHLRPLQVDTQCNRSAQSTLTRMKGDLEHYLWNTQVNIADLLGYGLGAWLARSPCNVKDRGWLHPIPAMLELLAILPRDENPAALDDEKPGELPENVVSLEAYRHRS